MQDVDSPDIAPPDEDSQSADSALVLSGANSPNEGQVKGKRYALQITVGGKLVIEDQEIGVADEYGDEYVAHPVVSISANFIQGSRTLNGMVSWGNFAFLSYVTC